jgi:hypothetical protein
MLWACLRVRNLIWCLQHWTVAFRRDMLDLHGVPHKAGEEITVTSKALKLEI